ncbi:hypothetical protein HJC23_012072 [Cyclotella cryptica]|uniref:Uncharacterized protein n=1 Tax=Cyclotella cryptica TaxID=29204 RepID=A0ABD3PTC4_9STRA
MEHAPLVSHWSCTQAEMGHRASIVPPQLSTVPLSPNPSPEKNVNASEWNATALGILS